MDEYKAAFASLDFLSPKNLSYFIDTYKNLKNIWLHINKNDLRKFGMKEEKIQDFFKRKELIIPEKELELLQKSSIHLLSIFDLEYPEQLKHISSPPVFIYSKGKWLDKDEQCLAVVGTRKISTYGAQATKSFVSELSHVFTIVSGLAYGVDALSHDTCLQSKGRTIAVLGSGLNMVYPRGNAKLAERILDSGGLLVSEFSPLKEAQPYHFPRRNRIIAGISRGVLVIEGEKKSGSLITAKFALEQNKEVFAVPGSVYSSKSSGTNSIIKKSEAKLVMNAEDILEEFQIKSPSNIIPSLPIYNLSDKEEKIYNFLDAEGIDVTKLKKLTDFSSACVLSQLSMLEMKGLVLNIGSGLFVKKV